MKKNLVTILEVIVVIMISQLSNAAEAPSTPDFTEIPELWTCGAEDWGPWYAQCAGSDDRPAAGKYSIILNYCQGAEHYLAFPKWRNANWDLSNAEYLEFKVRFPKGMTRRGPNPIIYLRSQDGPFIRIRPKDRKSLFEKESDGEWQAVRVPLKDNPEWETFNWLNASIKKIDFFELSFGASTRQNLLRIMFRLTKSGSLPNQPSYTPPNEQCRRPRCVVY